MGMPVLFLSHGSPMQALIDTEANRAWGALSAVLPKPKAIVVISAHWESEWPMVMAHTSVPILHDFKGFPKELYKLDYPAPGFPALAQKIKHYLASVDIPCQLNGCRGLDHGAWVPLRYMYPEANIPVIQISVQPGLNARHHWNVGQGLRLLRDEQILLIASGHLTHNLYDLRLGAEAPLAYALDFRDWVRAHLEQQNVEALLEWMIQAPYALKAHPTPEHFLPFFVALGAAGEDRARRIIEGWEGPSLSLDSYCFE